MKHPFIPYAYFWTKTAHKFVDSDSRNIPKYIVKNVLDLQISLIKILITWTWPCYQKILQSLIVKYSMYMGIHI